MFQKIKMLVLLCTFLSTSVDASVITISNRTGTPVQRVGENPNRIKVTSVGDFKFSVPSSDTFVLNNNGLYVGSGSGTPELTITKSDNSIFNFHSVNIATHAMSCGNHDNRDNRGCGSNDKLRIIATFADGSTSSHFWDISSRAEDWQNFVFNFLNVQSIKISSDPNSPDPFIIRSMNFSAVPLSSTVWMFLIGVFVLLAFTSKASIKSNGMLTI